MKACKICKIGGRYAKAGIREELENVNLYLLLLIVFLIIQFCFSGLGVYLKETQDSMNVFAVYTAFLSTPNSQIIYLIGVIILAAGSAWFRSGAPYYLIRSGRKEWVMGQTIYLAVMIVFFNLFLLICCLISCGGHITFLDRWSRAAFTACQYSPEMIGMTRPIVSFDYGLLQISPTLSGLITFAFSIGTGMITGILMIWFEDRNKLAGGVFLIFLLWYMDVLIEAVPNLSWLDALSVYGLSRIYRTYWGGGSHSVWYAFGFILCTVVILMFLEIRHAERIDFMKVE